MPELPKTPKQRMVAAGNSVLYPLIAIALLVLVWEPLSRYVSVGFIPTPRQVLDALVTNAQRLETYKVILITLRRVLISFVGAGLIGISLGIAMGLLKWVHQFSLPYVVVMMAIPGPVYVIMALLILGLNEWSSMTALMIAVTPYVANVVYQGTMARNPNLDEMTTHYHIRGFARLRHVILPQISPAILTGARTAFALSWKLVVLMEAMSRSDGIGAEILHGFKMLKPAQVLAFTTMFMIVMVAVELLVFKRLERYLLRWRTQPA